MSDIGLCVSKDASVLATTVQTLGSQWARWTADPAYERAQVAYAKALGALGIKRFLTFDMDSYRAFGDPHQRETWQKAHDWMADTFAGYIEVINPVNEPDGTGDESSTMTFGEVNGIIRIARLTWPMSTKVVGVGSVSGQADYYLNIDTGFLDGIDGHFYAKAAPVENPPDDFSLERIINEHLVYGKPLWMSEIGLSSDVPVEWDANGEPIRWESTPEAEERQAEYLTNTLSYVRSRSDVQACFWFCAHPYNGWGLWRPDGTLKPSYAAFQEVNGIELPPPSGYEYVLGFKDIHDAHPVLVGEPLENEAGIVNGCSFQATTNGWLYWGNIIGNGDTKGFLENNRTRYLWNGTRLEKVAA